MNIIHKACAKASKSLIRDFGEIEKLQVSTKGPGDFVSAADKRSEKIIIEELLKVNPKYGILSEEAGVKIYCAQPDQCDLLLFSYGPITDECIQASKILAKSGYKISVCSVLQVKPLPQSIIDICSKQENIISVEEHSTYHSVGSSLLKRISEKGHNGKFQIYGIEDKFTQVVGSRQFLLEHHSLDAKSLVTRIKVELE